MSSDEVDLPWGSLPVEQYLIQNWDHSSSLDPADQRAQLVAAYINEDVLDPSLFLKPPPRIPTPTEITTILAPYRPPKLRRFASGMLSDGHTFIFLRTHYSSSPADDANFHTWVTLDQDHGGIARDRPDDQDFSVLNDPSLFNFSNDWSKVYTVLPELAAGGRARDRRQLSTAEDIQEVIDIVAETVIGGLEEAYVEDYEEQLMVSAALGATMLVVADEVAFNGDGTSVENESGEMRDTGWLLMLIRDAKGRVIKYARMQADELQTFYIYWFVKGAMTEMPEWGGGMIGEEYESGGAVMKGLMERVWAIVDGEEEGEEAGEDEGGGDEDKADGEEESI